MGLRKRRGVEEAIVLKFGLSSSASENRMRSHLSRSTSR
jgi:hypothetical protein